MKELNELKALIKKGKSHEMVLAALFVLYIVFDIRPPTAVADLTDNIYAEAGVVIAALWLFMNSHAVVGVLGLIAAYEFVKRGHTSSTSGQVRRYLPSEFRKGQHLDAYNQFPVTLEEQVVSKMAPLVKNIDLSVPSYKPVLDDEVGGAPL